MESREAWERASSLFERVIEQPADQRSAWLRHECGGDEPLRVEVERLLLAHARTTGILDGAILWTGPDGEGTEEPSFPPSVGPYQLISEIGRGSMGRVCKARDPRLDRFVAIKLLPGGWTADKRARLRFLTEAKAASALDHPNICTIHDVGTHEDGGLYIVMAYYEGTVLSERTTGERIDPRESLDLCAQAARGLSRAHESGIIHRDIKPSNLLVTHEGVVKILDFGIAKLGWQAAHTDPGTVVGTPAYMSPEQARGKAVDCRSDLWSLAVVLYEMLTGARPFRGDEPLSVLHSILHDDFAPVSSLRPDLPRSLDAVFERALAKDPEQRYPSVDAFITATRYALDSGDAALAPTQAVSVPKRSSLPSSLTSFVGREEECDRMLRLVAAARLVTLLGPGGTGKTRLAVEVAGRLQAQFPDGVAFVPLAAVTEPELVPSAILRAVGGAESSARSPLESIKAELSEKRLLLVLDNFEQVVSAALDVHEILEASKDVKVVATSRVPLRVSGEHQLPVEPFEVPEIGPAEAQEAAVSCAAIRLFEERARAVLPDFRVDATNVSAVAEICRRLDGLPLAIELAAARTRVFTPGAMLPRLGRRLDLLGTGPRDGPSRHQTLRQTIAWSYELLNDGEKGLFRSLGVFVGGFAVEAAEAVAASLGYDPDGVVEGIATLVDHSLLRPCRSIDGAQRFWMLETIREFAWEAMRERGDLETARKAHASYLLSEAEQAQTELTGPRQGEWFDRLEAAHDDFQAALSYAEESGHAETALRLGAALWRFWLARGHLLEGFRRLEAAWSRAGDGVSRELRARVLQGLGTLAHNYGDNVEARRYLQESLRLRRELGEERGIAEALNNLGWTACELSDLEAGQKLSEEALALFRKLEDARGTAVALNNLGWVASYRGFFRDAGAYHREGLELLRTIGDARGIGFALVNVARAEHQCGNDSTATRLLDEASSTVRSVHDDLLRAWCLIHCAALEHDEGALDRALVTLEEALLLSRKVENRSLIAWALTSRAKARLASGPAELASRDLDEALEIWSSIQCRWGLAWTLFVRGLVCLARGSRDSVPADILESFSLRRSCGDRLGAAECLELLATTRSWVSRSPERAVQLLACASKTRSRLGVVVPRGARDSIEGTLERLRGDLGQERVQKLWDQAPGDVLDEGIANEMAIYSKGT